MAKQRQVLESMKADELRERAKEESISGTSHMRKEQLIETLTEGNGESQSRGSVGSPNEAERRSGGKSKASGSGENPRPGKRDD